MFRGEKETHRELRQEARWLWKRERFRSETRPLMSSSSEHRVLVVAVVDGVNGVVVEIDAAPNERRRMFQEVFFAFVVLWKEPKGDTDAHSCSGGDEREPPEPRRGFPRRRRHRRRKRFDGAARVQETKEKIRPSFFSCSFSHIKFLFFTPETRGCFVLPLPCIERKRAAHFSALTGQRPEKQRPGKGEEERKREGERKRGKKTRLASICHLSLLLVVLPSRSLGANMSDTGGGKDEGAPDAPQQRPGSASNEQSPSRTGSDAAASAPAPTASSFPALHHVPAPVPPPSTSTSLPHRTTSLVTNVPSSRVGQLVVNYSVSRRVSSDTEMRDATERKREKAWGVAKADRIFDYFIYFFSLGSPPDLDLSPRNSFFNSLKQTNKLVLPDRLLLQRLRKSQSGTTLYGDGQAALATAAESDAAALAARSGSGPAATTATAALAAQLAQASLAGSGSGGSGGGSGGFVVGPSSSSVPPSPSSSSSVMATAMPPPPSPSVPGGGAAPLSSSAPDSSAALFMSAALAKAASASKASAEAAAAATASASAAEASTASATAAAASSSPSRAAAAAARAAARAVSSPMTSPSPVPPAAAVLVPPSSSILVPPPPPPPATGTAKSSAYHGAAPPPPPLPPPGAAASASAAAAAQAAAAAEFVAAAQAAAAGASPRSGGETSRLIVVANRLPVSASRDKDGAWRLQVSAGGLVSALMSVRSFRTVWVGWPGVYVDEGDPARASLTSALGAEGYAPVYLDPKTVDLHYNGFCNSVLWQVRD